ncbi:MAG: alpha/beta hydrolase [Anaerolineae bacterium]|nr:alpha/beta hydrolase [Anaerolineae bacterium]MCI0609448.1 alpha/beta hydrolase [Anaerolineae bacterium]
MKTAFVEYGGTGLPLHFLHANGYPFYCYEPLLDLLQTNYHVFGMLLRPLWEDAKLEDVKDWHIFSDDLLHFLADYNIDPVIGVGHSIGAIVTLRAALRDPGKFRALVLIEPVLFPHGRMISWNFIRAIGLGNRLHPRISGALKRRRTFDDLDLVFRGYRNRDVFRYMSDENLRIYVEGITQPSTNGSYELVFSPEWEAHIYYTGLRDFDIWRDLPKLEVPTLFIRAAETDTFWEEAANLIKRKQSKARVETVEKSTHLLPLEHPKEVFEMMQSFLSETLRDSKSLRV